MLPSFNGNFCRLRSSRSEARILPRRRRNSYQGTESLSAELVKALMLKFLTFSMRALRIDESCSTASALPQRLAMAIAKSNRQRLEVSIFVSSLAHVRVHYQRPELPCYQTIYPAEHCQLCFVSSRSEKSFHIFLLTLRGPEYDRGSGYGPIKRW